MMSNKCKARRIQEQLAEICTLYYLISPLNNCSFNIIKDQCKHLLVAAWVRCLVTVYNFPVLFSDVEIFIKVPTVPCKTSLPLLYHPVNLFIFLLTCQNPCMLQYQVWGSCASVFAPVSQLRSLLTAGHWTLIFHKAPPSPWCLRPCWQHALCQHRGVGRGTPRMAPGGFVALSVPRTWGGYSKISLVCCSHSVAVYRCSTENIPASLIV